MQTCHLAKVQSGYMKCISSFSVRDFSHLGEARNKMNHLGTRKITANFAVCKADVSGATALSSSASCKDLYGTQCLGIYGKIRSWKSVAVLQMLEKQIGPESFRKVG